MTAIRAITFDLWGTLFRDVNPAERKQLRAEAFSRATGASQASVAEALAAVGREFARHHIEEQRTLTPLDAVRMTAERVGVVVPPDAEPELTEIFATAVLLWPPAVIEGAVEAVRAAARVVPLGIVSDTGLSPGRCLRVLLAREHFLEHFGALAFSDEVGVAKPRPEMFESAARDLGVAPSELLHIGDLEQTDIRGAHNVGAKAALFVGVSRNDLGGSQADHVLKTWQEFADALPSLLT